jgi:hypothetical protein
VVVLNGTLFLTIFKGEQKQNKIVKKRVTIWLLLRQAATVLFCPFLGYGTEISVKWHSAGETGKPVPMREGGGG